MTRRLGVYSYGRTTTFAAQAIDRIAKLADSLERAGVAVRRDVVPGVGHSGLKVLGPVEEFLAA